MTSGALWRPAYVAIGSNLNEPRERVIEAFERLEHIDSTSLERISRLYQSRPMGPQDQPDFVNAAAGLLTRLDAHELLGRLLSIERDMGRDRKERWGPRIIDLDLIWLVGDVIAEADLEVPHPGVSTRNFVLYPLSDIAPSLMIPGHGRVAELAARVGGEGISLQE